MTTTIAADLALDARANLGEGPVWDAAGRQLLWVDIQGEAVHLFTPATGADRAYPVGQPVGAAAMRKSGGVVLALRDGFGTLDLAGGAVTMIAGADAANPATRMNDGKCDAAGRFWAGTMAFAFTPGAGSLYRLDPDHSVTTVLQNVTVSNGLGWSLDGRTMYYIDTPTRGVDAFAFDADSGALANRRRLIDIPESAGLPDGMTTDADGCLWVALWSGGALHRYTPDGRLDRIVQVPTRFTTSAAFGGPALDELYITTASDPVPEAERAAQHAGGVFACRPGCSGLPANVYGG